MKKRFLLKIGPLSIFLFSTLTTLFSQSDWVSGTGNWNVATNWNPVGVPTLGVDVTITTGNVTIPTGYTAAVHNITISIGATLTVSEGGKLINNSDVTNDGTITVAGIAEGRGYFMQNGTMTFTPTSRIEPNTSNKSNFSISSDFDLGSTTYVRSLETIGFTPLTVQGDAVLTNAKLVLDWGGQTPHEIIADVLQSRSRTGTFNLNNVTIPLLADMTFSLEYTELYVRVHVRRNPTTITSAQMGNWNDPTTWVNGYVPRPVDEVIINHNVTIPTSFNADCNSLTVNALLSHSNLDSYLHCDGNMTVSSPGEYSGGSVLAVGAVRADIALGPRTSSSPANDKILNINGGKFTGSVILGGRMTATSGAMVDLKGGDFTGWSGGTPQYIIESDASSSIKIEEGEYFLRPNGTKPHFSPKVNLKTVGCPFAAGAYIRVLGNNGDFTFGETDRDQAIAVFENEENMGINSLTLNRITLNTLTYKASGGKVLNCLNCKMTNLDVQDVTLKGSYQIDDLCDGYGARFYDLGDVTVDNTFNMTINVQDSVTVDLFLLPIGTSFNLLGTFNLQHGQVIVRGGTLDLRNATVTGTSNENYFITQKVGSKPAAVLLPAVANNPLRFSLGVSVSRPFPDMGSDHIFAPVDIVSTIGNANVSISLNVQEAPPGFVAPRLQWQIEAAAASGSPAPTLTMTLTWPESVEGTAFASNRNLAKIFHYNSSTMLWEQLPTSGLTHNANGSWSLTATGVTSFSPFMVAFSSVVLAAELIHFSAKQKGSRTELTWQTASETNVQNFDVERSADGKNFSKIAEVKARNTPSVYRAFDDYFPESAYYRLKINDLDGKKEYSKTVFVEKNNSKIIKIRKNTEGVISIETDDAIEQVMVTNTVGQVLKSSKTNLINIADLPTGIYIVTVKTSHTQVSEKIFKD